MPQHITPITVFVSSNAAAEAAASADPDSRALTTGVGTLKFHMLLAQHGAGEFTTLYVPIALRLSFRPPAGGKVLFSAGAEA